MTQEQLIKHETKAIAYSERFQQKLLEYINKTPALRKERLTIERPIITTCCGQLVTNGECIDEEGGCFLPEQNEIIIEFKNISYRNLYATIRHEVIHAVLYNIGLPYKDEEALFYALALKFNALPYIAPANISNFLKGGQSGNYSNS